MYLYWRRKCFTVNGVASQRTLHNTEGRMLFLKDIQVDFLQGYIVLFFGCFLFHIWLTKEILVSSLHTECYLQTLLKLKQRGAERICA